MSSEPSSPRRSTSSVGISPTTVVDRERMATDQNVAPAAQGAPTTTTADILSTPSISEGRPDVSTSDTSNVTNREAQPNGTILPENDTASEAPNTPVSEPDSATVTNLAPPKRSKYSRFFIDWWAKEIIAAVLSILCFLSICIVLALYDGHPQPSIRWGITLNAVIALLTTIMKASLMTPLMEGISQLKWNAFMGAKRPLNDLNVYDAASRGGFGPLFLFWNMRKRLWREIVALAALFYFLVLGLDTFAQQLIQIQYQNTSTSSKDAFLLRSERYDAWYQNADNRASIVPDGLDPDMLAAVYTGLYGASTNDQDLFRCSSSNCTYPDTPSLAICARCHDLKSQLITAEDISGTTWTLPGGPEIVGITLMNVTSTANSSLTVSFRNAGPLIAAFSYINGTDEINIQTGKPIVPEASECALFLCVQAYNATVSQGRLTQTVVREWTQMEEHPMIPVADSMPASSLLDLPDGVSYFYDLKILTSDIPSPSAKSDFNMSIKAFLALQLVIPPLFSGVVEGGDHGFASGGIFPSDVLQRLYNTEDVPALVTRLADSMTASIRRNPATYADFLGTRLYSAPAYPGVVLQLVPFIHIVWPWITLLAGTAFFANVFLVYVIVRTKSAASSSEVGVWKSSSLPLLYHGLDADAARTSTHSVGLSTSVAEMEDHASRLLVRIMVSGDEGIKLC
ncbi:hypothetical protein LTR99_002431 [Exophiala xenobiotica]|uniref:Uncharacterized protein n=1 Tax=Vermiconidia calcicola TaxID=1690605 RepID=A0AAV9QJ75_9PEZI|nr:hypothetical protein LTR96_002670 [Exophiala xenobiotica]KAK5541496.1 hypothetical protein LTR23_005818 [Chaetothyriales sp. CCFEE 6169]KAK5542232.1 hypothetical protein LTR25_002117 [Vermiconidia calcicola]KAK5306739.1 hypothetical protein LTR99_002431 [Exophiala xenobiotica]KAK5341282.1 hypothetical protein LTR98_002074 [Exophiala xenobiotica]